MKRFAAAIIKMLGMMALTMIAGASCGNDDGLIVFAAASLDGHLPSLADETVSFAGSNALVAQILDGAPAGVLITANQQVAQPVIDELSPQSIGLVVNTITVVVPLGNPGEITSIEDLGDPTRTIAVCAPEVPCGQATVALSIPIAADSFEANVRSVLTKVELGEVDAGLVYRTDVGASTETEEVELFADSPEVTYLALLLDDQNPEAVAYFDWLGTDGRESLLASGFQRP